MGDLLRGLFADVQREGDLAIGVIELIECVSQRLGDEEVGPSLCVRSVELRSLRPSLLSSGTASLGSTSFATEIAKRAEQIARGWVVQVTDGQPDVTDQVAAGLVSHQVEQLPPPTTVVAGHLPDIAADAVDCWLKSLESRRETRGRAP